MHDDAVHSSEGIAANAKHRFHFRIKKSFSECTKHELGARSSDALADDRTKLQTAPGHLKAAGRLQQATATTSTAAASRVKVLNFLTFFLTGTLL